MSLKLACGVGCSIVVVVVTLLIGINALMRDRNNAADVAATQSYDVPSECTLKAIYSGTGPGGCAMWRYVFDVKATPDAPITPRVGFSNFFPTACGGMRLPTSRVGSTVRCWTHQGDLTYVRISPVAARKPLYRTIGALCLTVASALALVFVVYNVLLWLGTCLGIGPFRRDAEDRDRRIPVAALPTPRVGPTPSSTQASDPYEIDVASISHADTNWVKGAATNNTYARAVAQRLGRSASMEGAAEHEPGTVPIHPTHLAASPASPVIPMPVSARSPCPSQVPCAVSSDPFALASPNDDTPTIASLSRAPDTTDWTLDCCVCWDTMRGESIIFPCFHMACVDCATKLLRAAAPRQAPIVCPMCRRSATQAELRRIRLEDAEGR